MKRTDHPEFSGAWQRIQRDLANILNYAGDPAANRQIFDHLIADAISDLETIKTLIPAPTLAVGQKVRVTLDNGWLGKTGTVLQLARGLARVALYPTDTVGRAFHITDLEPAE